MSERTNCNCLQCAAACKSMPGVLAVEDIKLVEKYPDKFVASEGTVIMECDRRRVLKTIVPAQKPDGSCVFFVNGGCEIHDESPFGCRMFSVCQPYTRQNRYDMKRMYLRVKWSEDRKSYYYRWWTYLQKVGQIATSIEIRRRDYEHAVNEAKRQQYKRTNKKAISRG